MAEYLSPGVYVEEIEIGTKTIEGVSTSTAGFLGETERGSTTSKTVVSSWLQYRREFGGYLEDSYLPHAIEGFFKNGGQRCYVGRVVGGMSNKTNPATGNLSDKNGNLTLKLEAIGEGKWGNNIAYKLADGTQDPKNEFKLTLFYWTKGVPVPYFDPEEDKRSTPHPSVVEVFDNLSMESDFSNYYEKKINNISNLVTVENIATSKDKPAVIGGKVLALTNGSESNIELNDYKGIEKGDKSTNGLVSFEKIDDISILYSPNSDKGLTLELRAHCEKLKDRFVIIDAPINTQTSVSPRDDYETKYGAYYYPWIKIIDPQNGRKKLIPPGGYIAGIYARSDVERGVHKAPANEIVRGVVEVEFPVTKGQQDVLNPKGVNCIRSFPGRGIRVWGARTLSSDPSWKYINVRRLFMYLEESIDEGTQWVVFEPNSEILWARVIQTISNFLKGVWKSGALMGLTPEEAFFVKCDRTTMTQDDIDNGRLIVMIGVAPVKAAEFVIFRIAQWTNNAE